MMSLRRKHHRIQNLSFDRIQVLPFHRIQNLSFDRIQVLSLVKISMCSRAVALIARVR